MSKIEFWKESNPYRPNRSLVAIS